MSPISFASRKKTISFYLKYSLAFLVTAFFVYLPFMWSHKTFIFIPDGTTQHFNAFLYIGVYIRDILRTLIFEHRLEIPLWEFGIGYGNDVLTTLTYYVIGDPFSLLSVITPSSFAEISYCVGILLRIYFAGIAFSIFCKNTNCKAFATFIGALAYAFCGFSIIAAIRHPYFINPMIYLPLILLGVEKIFRHERPTLYIVMIFIAAFSNFYFFYMLVLLTILYVLSRFFFVIKEQRLKNLCIYAGKFLGFSLIGVLMAATLFLPICMAFLSDARSNTDYVYHQLYPLSYYTKFFGAFITNDSPDFWTHIGMSPIVLIAVITLFTQKRQQLYLKLQFLFLTLLLLLPIAGHVFNGFGYISNRWEFAYAFCLAFILVRMMPQLFTLTQKQKWIIFFSLVIYTAICFLLSQSRTEATFAAISVLFITVLFLFYIKELKNIHLFKQTISAQKLAKTGILLLTVCGILVNSFYRYSIQEWDHINTYQDFGIALEEISNRRENAWSLIEDDEFYRIDETREGKTYEYNHSICLGQSTTISYWSITSPFQTEYMNLNSLLTRSSSVFRSLQSRSLLEPFASTKYFVCEKGQEGYVPYGYEYIGKTKTYDDNTVLLYKTENALPLGYTTDTWVSYEDYLEMSLTERQEAMLQGTVLSEQDAPIALNETTLSYTHQKLPYELICDSNTEYKDGVLTVKQPNAKITLEFDCPENCELYAQLTGLTFQSHSVYDYYSDEDWNELSTYDINKIKRSLLFWQEVTSSNLKATCENCTSDFTYYTPYNLYTYNHHDYLFNLCYSTEQRTEMTITFSQPGEYTFEELSVISQPMSGLEEAVASMKEDVLENVEISTNRITGNISLEQDKLLCFSVPYSEGWSLYVDGEKTDVLRTNVMYMGTFLTAGDHEIELRYCTPYLKLGLLLSGIGVLSFIVYLIVSKKHTASSNR